MTIAQSDGDEVKSSTKSPPMVKKAKQTTKTITTMKKRNIFRTAWAMFSLALIAFVCVEWHRQGCGVWSIVAAISFYGVLSSGLLIAVEDVMERR